MEMHFLKRSTKVTKMLYELWTGRKPIVRYLRIREVLHKRDYFSTCKKIIVYYICPKDYNSRKLN